MLASIVLIATMGITPEQSDAGDVNWTIAPYLWASDVGLDVIVDSDPVLGANVPFKDIVDKLDGAFMGHIELSADQYGVFLDTIVINLADSKVVPVGPGGPVLGDLLVETRLKQKLFELAGFYRMGRLAPGSSAFDILLGARLVDVELTLDIVLPGPAAMPISRKIDISETDIIFGGRVVGRFNDKWGYKVRADYGAGGTEGEINALASIGYTFGKTDLFSIDVGYRYWSVEFKDESNGSITESEITMSGPLIGFIFTF
jgi:hypothetical protein